MPPFRPHLAFGFWPLTAAVLGAGESAQLGPAAGTVVARIQCDDDAKQSYALYLPSNYAAERAWPIIYCFDALGQGRRPVERFQQAAEQYGYIVVGSNNSRNGPWAITVAAAEAMLRDTQRRFHLDIRRCYAAGCSGGARAACLVAAAGHFAGVIACGGGFPGSTVPKQVAFAYFGSAGREDFNYQEMKQVEAVLAAQRVPHRLAIFDGGHEWLPASMAVEALGWMELQAMRSGRRPRDDALIGALFRQRLQTLAVKPDAGEAYLGYLAAVADFGGLTDTSEPAGKAAALKDTKAVRAYFKAEKKAEQQEQQGIERLYGAADAAHTWTPWGERQAASLLRDPSPTSHPIPGVVDAMEQGFGGQSQPDAWARSDFDRNEDMQRDSDRYAALRDVVDGLGRQAKSSVAARRALNGAFAVFFERGRAALEGKDYPAAVECFEIAAIIRPEMPTTYVALTRADTLRGEKREAREALQTAIARGFDDRDQIRRLQESLAP